MLNPIPRPSRLIKLGILGLASLLACPFVALASDGVAEINHTCAVLTGCFAGDTAGYPVTIDGQAGRSYRLTSDLIVPDENTDGIAVDSSDVAIDLNGFAIIRSGCESATSNCTPTSGTGSGIEEVGSFRRGVSVKNGSIVGMGLYGIQLGTQSDLRGLRVRWNRVAGCNADEDSIVSGIAAYQNGGFGIVTGTGTIVRANTTSENGLDGINAGSGSIVAENASFLNGGDGIQAASGVTVQRNTVRANGGYGLNLGSDSAFRENVITGNTAGSVNGGVNMASNSCNGVTICP